MGIWNVGLYSNDTACDVKTTYLRYLEQELNNEEAYKKTIEEYNELLGTDEEVFLWFALADTQWNVGRLMPGVKERALKQIDQKKGMSFWEGDSKKIAKWESVLCKLRKKFESPMPSEKKIKKLEEFVRNPWKAGDIYAYQFHTKKAEKSGLKGKYILFQKVGDVLYFDEIIFSVVQILDRVYDEVPQLADIIDIHVLPLVMPPGMEGTPEQVEDYIPSFEWYMQATMIYEKKHCYPKKYFTYVGSCSISYTQYEGNKMTDFYLEKDNMEEWLVDFYLNWQKVEYR